jgi:hypothetical protein
MPEEIANTKMLSSKIIFQALKSSPDFCLRLPDTIFPHMKPWLLNTVNSYCGGELQSLVQKLDMYSKQKQDDLKHTRSVNLPLFYNTEDPSIQENLAYQNF